MVQEDKKKFYEMLVLFSHGTMHDRQRLLHKYPEELVDEAIAKGYIVEIQKNQFGEPTYGITSIGKTVWE